MIHEHSFAAFDARLRGFIAQPGDDEAFWALAQALFALQFDSVPVFRELCVWRRILPEKLKHWNDIPAMPTSAFKEYAISSLEPGQRAHSFHSSGTTQQVPSRHFHDAESLATYEASLKPWFDYNFLGDSKNGNSSLDLLVLTPSPALAPHSSLAHMFGAVSPAFATAIFTGKIGEDGAWTLDLEKTALFLQKSAAENRPIAIVGTAFSLVHLFDYCDEKNRRWKLPEGSRVMETGGYKGRSRVLSKKELYALTASRLGVSGPHIVSEYGMSELSSQAYDTRIASFDDGKPQLTRAFHFPPWARAQVISAETGFEVDDGEIGLIRVFDLANVRSVLAIQTEDLAIRRGSGFELIGRAAQAEPRGCSLMPA